MKRKIIKIDEEKCNGCGLCIPDCHEGALKIVDGKAKLVAEALCDGLGDCLGNCPTGALVVEEREADAFDEEKVKENSVQQRTGCPGTQMQDFTQNKPTVGVSPVSEGSELRQWPVELKLLSPSAPYFKDADIVVAADCVPFSFSNFHSRFLKGKILIVFCPKLDNASEEYIDKMSEIFRINNIKSITIVHMEVPCCSGTVNLVEEALKKSGKNIIIKDYTISLQGEII